MKRLNPLNDFLFLKVMGEEGNEVQCLSFLNAVLGSKNKAPVKLIKILENRTFTAEIIDDKSCILDVRAQTDKGEKINIEVQLADLHNMEKRTLYYWGREYTKGIVSGDDYIALPRVININIVNFDQIKLDNFHTCFHLWEDDHKDYLLTDVLEIHFINMIKYKNLEIKDIENSSLVRWLTFFDKDSSKDKLEEVIQMDTAISLANDRLNFVSQDQDFLRIYEAREKALSDWTTGINTGIRKKTIEIAKNLLQMKIPIEQIQEATGLDIETIKSLI
jgi:predicted transposase/invertase (TIGR01784 family)